MSTPRDLRKNKMIAVIIEDSGSNITSWIAILKESQYQLLLKFTTLQPVLYSSLVSCDASMTIVNWIRGLEKKSNTYEHERPRFPFRESHSYLGSESKKYNFWNTKSVVLPFLANDTLLKLFKYKKAGNAFALTLRCINLSPLRHHESRFVTGGRDSCQDLGYLTVDALHEIPYVLQRTIQQNSRKL